MFRFDPALKVYLHREAVDGRKNINGLALLVEQRRTNRLLQALLYAAVGFVGGVLATQILLHWR